ncbi:MAG: hypothetical protein AVDCRST_MAG19-4928, partial [uncultured Thermomicrobiales bacterium]
GPAFSARRGATRRAPVNPPLALRSPASSPPARPGTPPPSASSAPPPPGPTGHWTAIL